MNKIYKCWLYFDEDHDEDEFIGGVEIDANSKEEVWDQLKKLIKIEEAKWIVKKVLLVFV